MSLPTERMRAEHRELLPRLSQLSTIADRAAGFDLDELRGRLDGLVRFLRDHLVPHARAEEAVLYPAVEQAMGSPGATATMVADHVEVVRRIDRLAETASVLSGEPLAPQQLAGLQAQLYGLWAILRLHFDKEESVLLPVLDESLSAERADALFAAMGERAGH